MKGEKLIPFKTSWFTKISSRIGGVLCGQGQSSRLIMANYEDANIFKFNEKVFEFLLV